jgi:hypothetical protein
VTSDYARSNRACSDCCLFVLANRRLKRKYEDA